MLNEAKGNMYSWITHTFNVIKGECPHACTYCYMHRFGKQKELRFDEKELATDLGSGRYIFVGSSCDMFAEKVPVHWIGKAIGHCFNFKNTYLFQTKNPKGFNHYHFPGNTRLCITLETNRWYDDIMKQSPSPVERAEAFSEITALKKYVTIEPVMDFDLDEFEVLLRMINPVQENIGADSGKNNLPEPSKEKLFALIERLQEFTTIDKKTNLKRLLNG